jgi:hypothetical protein
MGEAGLEPARISPPHFECGASTNSATRPDWSSDYIPCAKNLRQKTCAKKLRQKLCQKPVTHFCRRCPKMRYQSLGPFFLTHFADFADSLAKKLGTFSLES